MQGYTQERCTLGIDMCTPWRVEYTDSIENSLLQDGSGYECQGFNEIKKYLKHFQKLKILDGVLQWMEVLQLKPNILTSYCTL